MSLTLLQSPNIVLLVAAVVGDGCARVRRLAAGAHLDDRLRGRRRDRAGRCCCASGTASRASDVARFSWSEALAFAGLSASGLVLIQLERLVIPHVLPLADLALYGVLGAIAGSLFRVHADGRRLQPAAPTPGGRHRGGAPAAGRARGEAGRRHGARWARLAIWFCTPLVERWLLAGKYHLPGSLLLAAIVSGIAKIANAFSKATASALAEPRELSLVNLVGLGVGRPGRRRGLRRRALGTGRGHLRRGVGMVLARRLSRCVLVARHLRLPVSIPAVAP